MLLSKNILEQCEIVDEIVLKVVDKTIVIRSNKKNPRDGWEQQFLEAGSLDDTENLLEEIPTEFDEKEWTW